jgi:osmoprotectant transport system permease protein
VDFLRYLVNRSDTLLGLALEHVLVVAVSVFAATVIAVAVGLAVYRTDRPRQVALGVTSTFLTMPSFALFGLMIAPFGLGFRPTVVALTLYGLLPILRNTVTGLREVDPAIVESAQGMGMGRSQRLLRIELPLAWPVILTGIRVSTLLLVGIAAIAAIVGGGGLGEPIFRGLARITSRNALNQILSGVVGIIALAILFDLAFNLIGRVTTSRGIRG